MIFEHEIPKGSRLYFGKTAKAKRKLENKVCDILDDCGFEEILTPNFSYSQHQAIANEKKLIKFFFPHWMPKYYDKLVITVKVIYNVYTCFFPVKQL